MQCGSRPTITFLLSLLIGMLLVVAPEAARAAQVKSVIQPKAASQGIVGVTPTFDLQVAVTGTDNDGGGVDGFVVRLVNVTGAVLFSTNGQAPVGQTVTVTIPAAALATCGPAIACSIEVLDSVPGQPDLLLYRDQLFVATGATSSLSFVNIASQAIVTGLSVAINGTVKVLVVGPATPTLTSVTISGPGIASFTIVPGIFAPTGDCTTGGVACTAYTAPFSGTAVLASSASQFQKLIVQAQASAGTVTQSLATSVPLLFGKPDCTLAASPKTPTSGQSVTLTATCSNQAQVYSWSGPGVPASTTTSVPTFTLNAPTATGTYTYQVIGSNASGAGTPGSDSIVVGPAGTGPSGCSIAVSPPSPLPAGGGTITLTASCGGGTPPISFAWAGPGVDGRTGPTVSTTISSTQSFSVTASNTVSSVVIPAMVVVQAPVAPTNLSYVSGSPQLGSPGSKLADPFVVKVLGDDGRPFPNATFSTQIIPANGGTLTQLTATASDGIYQFEFVLSSVATSVSVKICLQGSTTQCATFISNTTAATIVPILQAQALAAITATTQQLSNIRQHLDDLRTARNPTVVQGLKISYDGQALPPLSALALAPTDKDGRPLAQKGGGASADDPFERWGLFVQGDVDVGKIDGTSTQAGFDIRTKGLTIGADYRLANNNVLGIAFGLVKATTDLNNNAGNQDTKGWSVSLFGEYVPVENAYIDLALTYGQNKYDSARRPADSTQTATVEYDSSPRGNQFGVSLAAGYQFYYQALTLTPYGRVDYVDASIDAFQESGGAGALQVSEQRYKSTVLTLGGQMQYAWNVSWGVLVPYARAEYQYAAQTSADSITAQFALAPVGNGVSLALPGTDKSYGNFSVGATAVLPRGFSGYFNYQYLFGKENYNDSRYTLGIRFAF